MPPLRPEPPLRLLDPERETTGLVTRVTELVKERTSPTTPSLKLRTLSVIERAKSAPGSVGMAVGCEGIPLEGMDAGAGAGELLPGIGLRS